MAKTQDRAAPRGARAATEQTPIVAEVVVSSEVRYGGRVYEAKDFAELVKKSVKELIEEAAATVGL